MQRPHRILVAAVIAMVASHRGIGHAADTAANQPIARLQITVANEPGQPLVITGTIVDRHGRPVRDAELRVYQADATGRYTPDKPMDEPHARLAGFLKAPDGKFELRTIRPGGYPKMMRLGDRDRHIPPHIHIDITCTGHVERRLQVVFADDPLLLEPYWADWVKKLRQPVLTVVCEGASLRGHLTIPLD